jgi:hypothetical protein
MGTSEGKPGRSPRKSLTQLLIFLVTNLAAHATRAALPRTTSAPPGRSILQRPWRATRPCRCWGECDAVGAGCLAVAQACMGQLSAEWGAYYRSRWVPARTNLVSLREKSQTQLIVFIVTMEFQSCCSRNPRSLSDNKIGKTVAQHLAKALACNMTLQTLQ